MESIKDTVSKKTFSIQNDFEIKQNDNLINKHTNSQLSKFDPTNMYSLHDSHDLNHIHGLRKY